MMEVTYLDVIDAFHSRFTDRYEIPETLERHWFYESVQEFELEVFPLLYNKTTEKFDKDDLPPASVSTLGSMMYVRYLTRELSRVLKLSGIVGKDLSITGSGDTKRVTNQELIAERELVAQMLSKYKISAMG